MADTDDALKHFMTSNDDPYTLLDLPNGPASTEKEIRSAWKKTALKYHPDKLRAKDTQVDEATANRLYILRQDAYGILSEPHLREQYDNALRAKEQKKQRDATFTGLKKMMKEDLERRENAAKRKRDDDDVGEVELERLRRDGQRRRRERAEMLRRQAEEEEREMLREQEEGRRGHDAEVKASSGQAQVQDIDRVVKLRFPASDSTAHLSRDRVTELFSRFGPLEGATLREKKVKLDGEKHRKAFMTVALIFESIVGAHAAVSDFSETVEREQGDWRFFEAPAWASGKEPGCIPTQTQQQHTQPSSQPPTATSATNGSNGNVDDILMIRLKNAEKKRREDKRRREEEALATAGDGIASTSEKKAVPTFASFKAKAAAVPGQDENEKSRAVEKRRLEEEIRKAEEDEDKTEAGRADGVAA